MQADRRQLQALDGDRPTISSHCSVACPDDGDGAARVTTDTHFAPLHIPVCSIGNGDIWLDRGWIVEKIAGLS